MATPMSGTTRPLQHHPNIYIDSNTKSTLQSFNEEFKILRKKRKVICTLEFFLVSKYLELLNYV